MIRFFPYDPETRMTGVHIGRLSFDVAPSETYDWFRFERFESGGFCLTLALWTFFVTPVVKN